MTIQGYVMACVQKMEKKGVRLSRFSRECTKGQTGHLVKMMSGEKVPTLETLRRMEAYAGISLDRIDPRIHRGEAQLPRLVEMINKNVFNMGATAEALGVEPRVLRWEMDAGQLAPRARVAQAIRICDMVEGRLKPAYRKSATQRTLEVQEKKLEDKLLKLPPEAQGDAEYLRARRAFAHCVPGNPRDFGLKKSGEGLYTAIGAALRWRLEIEERGVRVVALNKKTGVVLFDRLVPS